MEGMLRVFILATFWLLFFCDADRTMSPNFDDDVDDLPDPRDPFQSDRRPEQVMKGQTLTSSCTRAPPTDVGLKDTSGDTTSSSHVKYEEVIPSADNLLPDLLPPENCEDGSLVFVRRIISSVLHHITEKSSTEEYTASLSLSAKSLASLTMFIELTRGGDVHEACELLVNSINVIKPAQPTPSPVAHWLSQHEDFITTVMQILLILTLTLILLIATVKLWWGIGCRRFLIFLTVLIFCVSVPWTWVHLYKQNVAGRMKRADAGTLAPECDPHKLSWSALIFTDYSGRCAKYYEDQYIDPLWEVKPTMAIAYTVVDLFWKPLGIMGGPLGTFVKDFLDPLPFYVKPVAAVFGLMFAWWCIVLFSGMRVWTWFFTIEPVITAQHELNAIRDTVTNLNAIVERTADSHEQRDSQLKVILDRLTSQADHRDDMGEMIPVLQNICANYGQQQNNGLSILTAVVSPHSGGLGEFDRSCGMRLHGAGDMELPESTSQFADVFGLAGPDHVVLTTRNVDDVVQFYSALGMVVKTFSTNRKALHFGKFKINLHEAGAEISPHAENPTPSSLDICIACTCQVETTINHLKTRQLEIELGPVERTGALGKITSIYVRDPDRNLVELAHYCRGTVATSPANAPQESTQIILTNIGPTTDPL